ASELHRLGDGSVECHLRALLFQTDRLELYMLPDRLATAGMHHTSRGADVGVVEARNVFFDEIDKKTLTLEQPEPLKGCVRRRCFRLLPERFRGLLLFCLRLCRFFLELGR